MENGTPLPIVLGILKNISGTAVSDSAANAERAEAAAELAQQHSIGFEDDGTGLVLKPIAEEA